MSGKHGTRGKSRNKFKSGTNQQSFDKKKIIENIIRNTQSGKLKWKKKEFESSIMYAADKKLTESKKLVIQFMFFKEKSICTLSMNMYVNNVFGKTLKVIGNNEGNTNKLHALLKHKAIAIV